MEYRERRYILLLIFTVVFSTIIIRLFFIQIVSDEFAKKARNEVVRKEIQLPARGIIYDREGNKYVTNTPIFDIEIIHADLDLPDTTIFEKYLDMSRDQVLKKLEDSKNNKYRLSTFKKYIDAEKFFQMQEHLWRYKGISSKQRSSRKYLPVQGVDSLVVVGSSFLGYISEVHKSDIMSSEKKYYSSGDLIGTTGLERYYEKHLRGVKGEKMILTDAKGRYIGPYAEGKQDFTPVAGKDIVISIDTKLQSFGEKLMKGKIGSIVAIEPATGEILAFISAPTYDPSLLLAGKDLPENYRKLKNDSLRPLLNRTLMGRYPPGSIFKLFNGLIALAEGTVNSSTVYHCPGYFAGSSNNKPGCHLHPSPLSLKPAIQYSCNSYFSTIFVNLIRSKKYGSKYKAYQAWYDHMVTFGIGQKLGIDIPSENSGKLPQSAYYDKVYRKHWNGLTIVSNAIGQGEILMTPLQMANATAVLANRGYYIQPHFFKKFHNSNEPAPFTFKRINTAIDTSHFEVIADAMENVVVAGTGSLATIPGIRVCGKTGTVENPRGADHSVFIAFAPKYNPKIAIAVIVENAGFGGVVAAPIASLMIEQYLNTEVSQQWKVQMILGEKMQTSYTSPVENTPILRTDSTHIERTNQYLNIP